MTNSIPLEIIQRARDSLDNSVLRTPLLPLHYDSGRRIFLKLENLQPIGSFKLRGAGAAMALRPAHELAQGVYTASAGNMAQGVAYCARRRGIPSTAIVPDHAPDTKLRAIQRLGGNIHKVPFDRWWRVIEEHSYPGMEGLFIHPVTDPLVMAGNGTIGLEILEQLSEVDTIVVPYGGGGLSCGIASAFRALKPETRVFASEVETAAPLSAALQAGQPVEITYQASFVDGIGGKSVLRQMWPLATELLAGSLVVSLEETASALRLLLERNRVLAEGAAATSVAAALSGQAGEGTIVCIISGGNLDFEKLTKILWEPRP